MCDDLLTIARENPDFLYCIHIKCKMIYVSFKLAQTKYFEDDS